MNTPATPKPSAKKPVAVMGAAAALVLSGLLATSESGKKQYLTPYYDQAGVLTYCDGLTGGGVKETDRFTPKECDNKKIAFIQNMSAQMGHCVPPMTDQQWIAWGHFTYNTGVAAFCKSSAASLLRQGNYTAACASMKRWTWITKPGIGPVNCRDAAQRCSGIPKRRDFEYGLCMDAI